MPTQVNYVGKGASLYREGIKPSGAHLVARAWLRTSWLWDKVRVQVGAYGGQCMFNRYSGDFTFVSYRDPNLLATLDIYDRTADFLRTADLGEVSRDTAPWLIPVRARLVRAPAVGWRDHERDGLFEPLPHPAPSHVGPSIEPVASATSSASAASSLPSSAARTADPKETQADKGAGPAGAH